MARPLRVEYPGAFYHVTSRGNERRKIFHAKSDYEKFKTYLKESQEKFSYLLHSYVLMGNHYHLLIETPEGNLRRIMHYINGAYTNYVNRRKGRSGHLFQGRYKAILVDRDNYLLELSRYIHLNPVRAGIAESPQAYPCSSYPSFIHKKGEEIVFRDLILSMISNNEKDAPGKYKKFVESGMDQDLKSPMHDVYGGSILGSKQFIKGALSRIKETTFRKGDVSFRRELTAAFEPGDICATVCGHFEMEPDALKRSKGLARNMAIHLMKKHTGMMNREIGAYFGLSYSAVSKAEASLLEKAERDRKLKKSIQTISDNFSNFKG